MGQNVRLDDSGRPVQSADDVSMRPAYASGSLNLLIPATSYELNCIVTPKTTLVTPGSGTEVDVLVKNAEGNPIAGAEVTLVAVDEAVLSLTGYSITNPIAQFYQVHSGYLSSRTSRSLVLVKNWSSISIEAATEQPLFHFGLDGGFGGMFHMSQQQQMSSAPMMAQNINAFGASSPEQKPMIKVRSNFDPLAIFAPLIKTDANGGQDPNYLSRQPNSLPCNSCSCSWRQLFWIGRMPNNLPTTCCNQAFPAQIP